MIINCKKVIIPLLKIEYIGFMDVPILIIPNSKSDRLVLGTNILSYLNYCVDSEDDKIYFSICKNPKPLRKDLSCGKVYLMDDT